MSVTGKKRPVALLQIASHKGLCALIRLCKIRQIPLELREFLEDESILKVGIVPNNDSIYLTRDYGVRVASTFDLRFLASMVGMKPEGLGKMSQRIIGVELDKDWRVRCSDWEANELTEKQIDYAAKDALCGIELFKKMSKHLTRFNDGNGRKIQNINEIIEKVGRYINLNYFNIPKTGTGESLKPISGIKSSGKLLNPKLEQKRQMATLAKPLYDNAYLQAPDGEMLCTCDRKKAQWYVKMNLGKVVEESPFTVKLNFEPAGRAVGEVGQFYLQEKKNGCVVCGKDQSYLRKNIIPPEYRKLFPNVMKDHSSHDIILLCVPCHQLSNVSDDSFKEQLEMMCTPGDEPRNKRKVVENPEKKKIRSAARALLNYKDKIPENRTELLMATIKEKYPDTEIEYDLLMELSEIDIVYVYNNI